MCRRGGGGWRSAVGQEAARSFLHAPALLNLRLPLVPGKLNGTGAQKNAFGFLIQDSRNFGIERMEVIGQVTSSEK